MSRRKGEVTGHMNEQSSRSQLELLPGGFRSQNLEFDAFHREHGIPIRVAAAGMRCNSTSASASPMPPLLMLFGSASAARA